MNLKSNQQGNTTGIALIIVSLLFIGAFIFGIWAFSGRQNYKNNTESIATKQANAAVLVTQAKDLATYNQELKNPYRTYVGPAQYGAVKITYPNTWSAYVDDTGSGAALLDAYFDPGHVPSVSSSKSVFALRTQVIQQPYATVVQNFNGFVQNKTATVSAYSLPNLPNTVGIYVTGNIGNSQTGQMVVLPLRTYTIEISTMGTGYVSDFKDIILKNFTFSP